MTRLLILTAGYGEGHNAAARNLAAAAESLAGPGSAAVVDLLALTSPRFNRIARRAYLAAINGSPRLWRGFYGWSNRSGILPRHLWMLRAELRTLALAAGSRAARRRVRHLSRLRLPAGAARPRRRARPALLQRGDRLHQHPLALDVSRLRGLVRAQRRNRGGHAVGWGCRRKGFMRWAFRCRRFSASMPSNSPRPTWVPAAFPACSISFIPASATPGKPPADSWPPPTGTSPSPSGGTSACAAGLSSSPRIGRGPRTSWAGPTRFPACS